MKVKALTPKEVMLLWSTKLEKIFIKILSHSRHDDTLESILKNVLNNKLIIWAFYCDDFHLCGISTTKIIIGDNEKSLVIDHVWANTKYVTPFKDTMEGMKVMEGYAKATQCNCIKCYSMRGDKYFKIMGFTPSYTEYVKEIKNESV